MIILHVPLCANCVFPDRRPSRIRFAGPIARLYGQTVLFGQKSIMITSVGVDEMR